MSKYDKGGRNLFIDSKFLKNFNSLLTTNNGEASFYNADVDGSNFPLGDKGLILYAENYGDSYTYISQEIPVIANTQYTLTFYQNSAGAITGNSSYIKYNDDAHVLLDFQINNTKTFEKKTITFITRDNATSIQLRFGFLNSGTTWMSISGLMLERGAKSSEWKNAPEDENYISIAGNIDDITDFTTNAETLWERL